MDYRREYELAIELRNYFGGDLPETPRGMDAKAIIARVHEYAGMYDLSIEDALMSLEAHKG